MNIDKNLPEYKKAVEDRRKQIENEIDKDALDSILNKSKPVSNGTDVANRLSKIAKSSIENDVDFPQHEMPEEKKSASEDISNDIAEYLSFSAYELSNSKIFIGINDNWHMLCRNSNFIPKKNKNVEKKLRDELLSLKLSNKRSKAILIKNIKIKVARHIKNDNQSTINYIVDFKNINNNKSTDGNFKEKNKLIINKNDIMLLNDKKISSRKEWIKKLNNNDDLISDSKDKDHNDFLGRIVEIAFNKMYPHFNWNSKIIYGYSVDFTDMKSGITYDCKGHRENHRLQLSAKEANAVKADYLVSMECIDNGKFFTIKLCGAEKSSNFKEIKSWEYKPNFWLKSKDILQLQIQPGNFPPNEK